MKNNMMNYQNPVVFTDNKRHTNPDPYILEFAGNYFCYSSDAGGVNVSKSKNLVNWEYLGYAIEEEKFHDYWAPCVFYRNGKFYMYYSNTPLEETDCHQEFLKLAVADRPEGPYIYRKTFFEKFSIDAHVVTSGRELYLFYSVNDITGTEPEKAGTCILVDKLVEMDRLEGNPKPVILPSIAEEIFQENRFRDGRDWYTIEGAFYLRNHDVAYCMYSANAYVNTNYYIGYSRGQYREDLRKVEWKKYPDNYTFRPLVQKSRYVEGTGHNSVIKGPDLMENYIVYHGREAAEGIIEGTEQRQMRVDTLWFDGDRLMTEAPSHDNRPVPAGAWEEAENIVISGSEKWFAETKYKYYVARMYLNAKAQHTGERYGIYLYYQDGRNYTEAEFSSGRESISINEVKDGVRIQSVVKRLPEGYLHQIVHKIEVYRKGSFYSILVDDIEEISFTSFEGDAKMGICTYFSEINLIHISISRAMDLWKRELAVLGSFYQICPNLDVSEDGITAGKEAVLIRDYESEIYGSEEFTFLFYGSQSRLLYEICADTGERVTVCIERSRIQICCQAVTEEFRLEDAYFTLRQEVTERGVRFRIHGNCSTHFSINGSRLKSSIRMEHLTLCGMRRIEYGK